MVEKEQEVPGNKSWKEWLEKKDKSYGISHILDFAGCMPAVSFNMFF